MTIELSDLISKYNLKIKGVIHAGAHHGQEYETYCQFGIAPMVFIEPCSEAFTILHKNLAMKSGVHLFHTAVGAYNGKAEIYVEEANAGQSNSILRPLLHLKQYPKIKFLRTEKIDVCTLDSLMTRIAESTSYNFLNMDVQGYEGNVLRGAVSTLCQIEYVYTEINIRELYENCTRMNEIDEILKDFERVETDLVGRTWGDAFYVRRSQISSGM